MNLKLNKSVQCDDPKIKVVRLDETQFDDEVTLGEIRQIMLPAPPRFTTESTTNIVKGPQKI